MSEDKITHLSEEASQNSSLQRALAAVTSMQLKARERNADYKESSVPLRPDAPGLPPWPELVRGAPNVALRTALFGAIRKGTRVYLERQVICAQGGIEIVYTGARLDQGDFDVWLAVLHLARTQPLDNNCRITAYQLLKTLSKTDTGLNRNTLSKSLSRMKATGLDITVGRYSYEGSLIDEVYRDKKTKEYVILLNPKLSVLFASDQFTQLDLNVRRALDGQPLAQWLHGLYASHAKPFPMKMGTLLQLSGSENKNPRSSHQKLRKALDAVKAACIAHGQFFDFEVRGDLVYVEKKGSKSQQRHLETRSLRAKRRNN